MFQIMTMHWKTGVPDENVDLLFQGAEAKLYTVKYEDKCILVKERLAKRYRHAELDQRLTSRRITQVNKFC